MIRVFHAMSGCVGHTYRSAQSLYVVAAMSRYSLCKHGHNCRWHAKGICGFAHRIDEVVFPAGTDARSIGAVDKRRWVCDAHLAQGHPAYDKYVGQRLSPYQWGRILLYIIDAESDSNIEMPMWARMVLWFQGKRPLSHFVFDDFCWSERMREELRVDMPSLYAVYAFQWDPNNEDVLFPEAFVGASARWRSCPYTERLTTGMTKKSMRTTRVCIGANIVASICRSAVGSITFSSANRTSPYGIMW